MNKLTLSLNDKSYQNSSTKQIDSTGLKTSKKHLVLSHQESKQPRKLKNALMNLSKVAVNTRAKKLSRSHSKKSMSSLLCLNKTSRDASNNNLIYNDDQNHFASNDSFLSRSQTKFTKIILDKSKTNDNYFCMTTRSNASIKLQLNDYCMEKNTLLKHISTIKEKGFDEVDSEVSKKENTLVKLKSNIEKLRKEIKEARLKACKDSEKRKLQRELKTKENTKINRESKAQNQVHQLNFSIEKIIEKTKTYLDGTKELAKQYQENTIKLECLNSQKALLVKNINEINKQKDSFRQYLKFLKGKINVCKKNIELIDIRESEFVQGVKVLAMKLKK